MKFFVVIPARYASVRLPGKPLRELAGAPLIEHVWRRATDSGAQRVIIATDDERIFKTSRGFGAEVVMTSPEHASGTDRIAEVARLEGWDEDELIVNLQGDEPLMPPETVRQVAELLWMYSDADMATLCTPIHNPAEWQNPNVVKVVLAEDGSALYFSRATIPFRRDAIGGSRIQSSAALRHVGLYAYRTHALLRMSATPACEIESTERLEQLRALWMGLKIQVDVAKAVPPPGVDTKQDLQRADAVLRGVSFS